MKVETYSPKDAMGDFLKILDQLDGDKKRQFLEGLNIAFFDPLGRRILKHLAKDES